MITPATPITVEIPVVTTSMQTQSFPALWVRRLIIDSPDSTHARATAFLAPYDPTSGTLAPTQNDIRIEVPNVFAPATLTPTVQNAMAAIFAAITEIAKAQGKIQ
jgi:hypothetical protein